MGEVDEVFCDGCIVVAQEADDVLAHLDILLEFCDGCIVVAQAALQQMGQAPLPLPEAVAQVVAQGAWSVLVRALPHEAVRAAVVELGTPAVLPLIQALGDGTSYVRAAACRALGAIGDRQAVPPLIQALGDWHVREAACRALGQIGDPQALSHLIQALEDEDKDKYVRWAAREAVEQIKAKQFARNKPLD
jgi:HEAT repeat protein